MSILVDETTRVLVQGITGRQASLHVEYMLRYGTRIVAGVSPGKGGGQVHGVPVYETVREAVAEHGLDASVVMVPALMVRDAVLEAIDVGIRLIVVPAEGVPYRDASIICTEARRSGVTLVGPNAQGIISPGKAKLGGTGGDNPARMFRPGRVGVISRSGGMGAETCWLLSREGIGQSTYVAIGGDLVTGSGFKEMLQRFEDDHDTDLIVLFGEPGSEFEEEAAEFIAAGMVRKPVVAHVAGRFQERLPEGISFGHTAGIIRGGRGSPSAKARTLRNAGVIVAERWSEIARLVKAALSDHPRATSSDGGAGA